MKPIRLVFALVTATPTMLMAIDTIDLSGTWQVALDRADAGIQEKWFSRNLSGPIHLPGSLQQARLGDPVTVETKWTGGIFDRSYFTAPDYAPYREPGNIKIPFWLQPETHYTGAAWYQRTIEIPPDWATRRVTLLLERPHWTTSVWLDERLVGRSDANSVAHVFELGTALTPGRHRLTIRVDNRLDPDIGENSHSVSDHTQGNWNGIVGRIELRAGATVRLDEVEVYPNITDRTAVVRGRLARSGREMWPTTVRLASASAATTAVDAAVGGDGSFETTLRFPADAPLWDEFSPALHTVTAGLPGGDTRDVTFGFREFSAEGHQLTLNGRKLFLRGTLDCAIFPKTGHPPTDAASWEKVFQAIKAHGLNHVRFHSWCPPEAAFRVADTLGVYLQVEVASWPNQSTTLGDGKPVDAWIDAETDRILRAYGNHPSFLILCAGNEPGGPGHEAWLAAWLERQKARDPRRLHTAGAGWPELPENQIHSSSEPRIQHWGEGLASRINALPPETRTDYTDFIHARTAPVISHEIGQWCVYPNFEEMPKYTGYLKPRNFEIFQARLTAHGMAEQARDFLIASGKLQALCYKEDIESALRTPEMGGFQLLGLQDFPGQGTALVGVVDPFWEDKGYVTPEEFRRFCSSTVPLARLERRVFTVDEHLTAEVEVAHFASAPLAQARASWQLVADDGQAVAGGTFGPRDIPVGARQHLGRIDQPLRDIAAPARYRLVVALDGTTVANDWEVWVYPSPDRVVAPRPGNVTIATRLDAAVERRLAAGDAVWLMLAPREVRPDPDRGRIALGFSSIFWNTAWTSQQAPHTLGILCDPRHPALARFPTDAHSNWQWWYPVTKAAPMILDDLPRDLRPVVQVIDDWFTARKLGLVLEARVGPGRLLVSSIDLSDAALDPVRRQLRASLLAYACGPDFKPATDVTIDQIRSLIAR